jgi:hypothetical protein
VLAAILMLAAFGLLMVLIDAAVRRVVVRLDSIDDQLGSIAARTDPTALELAARQARRDARRRRNARAA